MRNKNINRPVKPGKFKNRRGNRSERRKEKEFATHRVSKQLGSWTLAHLNVNRTDLAISEGIDLMEGDLWALGLCDITADIGVIANNKGAKFVGINNAVGVISNMEWKVVARPSGHDVIAVSGHCRGRRIGIVEFYWKPWSDVEGDVLEIIDRICRECLKGHELYVLGDCNTEHERWSLKESRETANKMLQLMDTWNLSPSHSPREDNWTWSRGLSRSWLDVILVRGRLQKRNIRSVVEECTGSDHRMVKCTILHVVADFNKKWSKINTKALREDIVNQPIRLELKADQASLEKDYDTMVAHVSNLVANVSCDSRGRLEKRVGKLASDKSKIRRKLKRLNFNREGAIDHFLELCRALESVKRRIGEKHLKLIRSRKEKLLAGALPPWKTAEMIFGKGWNRIKDSFSTSDDSALEISKQKFLENFTETGPDVENGERTPMKRDWNWLTRREWKNVVIKMRKKGCKYNKYLDSKSFSHFLELDASFEKFFEIALGCALMPNRAFVSRITLIPKANGTQVRPIAIMNAVGRAADCCVNTVLDRPLTATCLPYQWGFSKGKGASDLFIEFLNWLNPLLTTDVPIAILVISFDLSNAFENFKIDKCFSKLRDMGYPLGLRTLIKRMLAKRVSFVEENGKFLYNSKFDGSFQGGFMSPTLFNICTKDIYMMKWRDLDLKTLKFADDMVVCSEVIQITSNKRISKTDLIRTKNFAGYLEDKIVRTMKNKCRDVGLSINQTKTKGVLLTNSRIAANFLKKEERPSIRILGLNLRDGRLIDQLESDVIDRLRKVLEMVEGKRKVCSELPTAVIPVIYEGIVNSVLRYFYPFLMAKRKYPLVVKLCTDIVRALCDATNSSNVNIVRAVLKLDHPERVVCRSWLTRLRRNGFKNAALARWPEWCKNLIYRSKNLEIGPGGCPPIVADEWIEARREQVIGTVLVCYLDTLERSFINVSFSGTSYHSDFNFEFAKDEDKLGCYLRAALIEFLDCITPLPYDRDGLMVIQCPPFAVTEPFGLNSFNYLEESLKNFKCGWCIQEMEEYSLEEVFASCGKPNWLSNPTAIALEVEEEIFVENKVWKEFRSKICPRYQLDYVVMLAGSWHRFTNRRTCICGGKLSTLHILWSCKHMKRPEWMFEGESCGMKTLLARASSRSAIMEIGEASERVLRLNRINLTSRRMRISKEDLMSNDSKSRWKRQPLFEEHNYHLKLLEREESGRGEENIQPTILPEDREMHRFHFDDHNYHLSSKG